MRYPGSENFGTVTTALTSPAKVTAPPEVIVAVAVPNLMVSIAEGVKPDPVIVTDEPLGPEVGLSALSVVGGVLPVTTKLRVSPTLLGAVATTVMSWIPLVLGGTQVLENA